jgi:hypothetical protein
VKTLLLAGAAIIALSTTAQADSGFIAHCQYHDKSIEVGMLADQNNNKAFVNAGAGDVMATHAPAPGGGTMVWENDTPTVWFVGPSRGHSSVKLNGKWRPMQCGGFQATSVATNDPAPAYVPPAAPADVAPPTYASAPASLRLPIAFGNSGAYVAVSIGTIAANMLVDTGATGMTVSESIADSLIANGQATEAAAEMVGLAGGVKREFRQVDISSVTVGGHVVTNVHAGVVPDGSDMLLGLGVLAKVSGKFAINVANSTLDFD